METKYFDPLSYTYVSWEELSNVGKQSLADDCKRQKLTPYYKKIYNIVKKKYGEYAAVHAIAEIQSKDIEKESIWGVNEDDI